MSGFRSQNSYSVVLSAGICLSFSPFVNAQGPGASPLKQQQDSIGRQAQSIELQRQSVARQRAVAGPAPGVPSLEAANSFACEPASAMQIESAVHDASQRYKVAPELIRAVIRQESGGYPCAISQKGAMGLMQLMPATALDMGVAEPFDVAQNVFGGTRFLAELMGRYQGDLIRVLGAYNAGPAAVDRSSGLPPFPETVNYIQSILGNLNVLPEPKVIPQPVR